MSTGPSPHPHDGSPPDSSTVAPTSESTSAHHPHPPTSSSPSQTGPEHIPSSTAAPPVDSSLSTKPEGTTPNGSNDHNKTIDDDTAKDDDENIKHLSSTRSRTNTAISIASGAPTYLRRASLKLLDSDPPPGFMYSLGQYGSQAPTPNDIRSRSYTGEGWQPKQVEGLHREAGQQQDESRGDHTDRTVPAMMNGGDKKELHPPVDENAVLSSTAGDPAPPPVYSDWLKPEPLPWTKSMQVGLRAFSFWVLTIPGFLITVYALNIVAWGGMLFLLLCNAAPAMCKPSCNDINSPRRKWVEIDSQILNGLFCVTGFGLAPWRIRDLWYWCKWRLGRSQATKNYGIRRLAGIHRGWYRLPGSQDLPFKSSPELLDPDNLALPFPTDKAPSDPLTRQRAPPTTPWKMDYVVWCNMWNTFFQACLAGLMWGLNRYNRPGWSTGLFVALACGVAGMGGVMVFQEGKRVKEIEGAEISEHEKHVRGWTTNGDDPEKQLNQQNPTTKPNTTKPPTAAAPGASAEDGLRGGATGLALGLAEVQEATVATANKNPKTM